MGHLAAESGWVGIPGEEQAESARLYEAIALLLDKSVAAAPERMRAMTGAHTEALARRHGSVGDSLVTAMRARIEDYMANLLAQRFLTADEMQTYVRNKVAGRIDEYEPGEAYQQIMRHAYEIQYLQLVGIERPLEWLASSAWIDERFIHQGVIAAADWAALVALVGELCAWMRAASDSRPRAERVVRSENGALVPGKTWES